ncbi:MAG: hypothetical protein OXJ54_06175 [Gemmatimonadetes bacterium]|nr:hypothetical protein [Candidatus Palauibacter rhopaloidicola]
MRAVLKLLVSVIVCLLAGLAGLALVFRDLPVGPGPGLIALGGVLYFFAGFGLARWHRGARPLLWGLAPGWSLALLGVVGVWVTLTDPPSGHWGLALLFLLGPAVAGSAGTVVATRTRMAARRKTAPRSSGAHGRTRGGRARRLSP